MLAELAATFLVDAGTTERRASSVRRIFVEFTKLLDACNAALAKIDQIAAELVARHGYPRVAAGSSRLAPGVRCRSRHDPAPARHRVGSTPPDRQPARRQSRFMQIAEAVGLPAAQT
ncbi:hypothetical protein MKK75_09815 [Methylobacterium sp. J-030]|uniref:hypothetical protein n=1 Tax=Methylobacterium sp. J-030 TaxID=2836627 RepID=UPI001FBB6C06|nr:hypothetical protein [Methylobacterium sp. J-030]MCJ2069094.1 hypothetical protein [Methylobacterium sp. J-030]